MRPRLRVKIRSYCYGCRRELGERWHRAYATNANGHRIWWDFYIHCDGRRLVQRQGFATFDRALSAAARAYAKLADSACITEPPPPNWTDAT